MIGRVEKFLSYRFFPPLDTRGSDAVSHAENALGINNTLHIKKASRPGFYMLECRFRTDVMGEVIRFAPIQSITPSLAILPLQMGRLVKRIVRIAFPVEGWQLSVLDESGEFVTLSKQDCEYLRLVPLRRTFASKRMLRRLNQPKAAIKQQAKKHHQPFIDELYGLYDRSFTQSSNEHYQQWIDLVESEQVKAEARKPASSKKVAHTIHCAPPYQITSSARTLLVAALANNPQAQLIYTDEDQLDAVGARKNPCFKPGWNPDLFMAQDYISACYICRDDWYVKHQATFERLGPRLALSALLPTMGAEEILHLPRVLAHKIAMEVDETQQPDWAQRRIDVLQQVLPAGMRSDVQLELGLVMGSVRVKYAVPEPAPLVSLLIPTRDGLAVLKPCVESILEKTDYPNYEVLILDNQSEAPETLNWLAEVANDERVRVLPYNKPFNYSAINNFGAEQAKGSVIGLINNDVEVISAGWLTEMVAQALRPEIGCVGAKLYYSNGQIQHAGVILGLGDVAGHAHRFLGRDDAGYHDRLKLVQNYSAVTAACLLVRREIYDAVDGLEEGRLTVAYNDVDFCIRVREAGYRNLWTPYAELYHHESISRGEDDTPVKKARYQKEVAYMHRTWKAQLKSDPCYNPNLCRRREDFSLPDVLF